jgi:hypothetical protein
LEQNCSAISSVSLVFPDIIFTVIGESFIQKNKTQKSKTTTTTTITKQQQQQQQTAIWNNSSYL